MQTLYVSAITNLTMMVPKAVFNFMSSTGNHKLCTNMGYQVE